MVSIRWRKKWKNDKHIKRLYEKYGCEVVHHKDHLKHLDHMSIPLLQKIHKYIHDHGEKAAELKYNLNFDDILINTLLDMIEELWEKLDG